MTDQLLIDKQLVIDLRDFFMGIRGEPSNDSFIYRLDAALAQPAAQGEAVALSDDEIATLAYRAGWDVRYEDYEGEETEQPHLWSEDGDDSFDSLRKLALAIAATHPPQQHDSANSSEAKNKARVTVTEWMVATFDTYYASSCCDTRRALQAVFDQLNSSAASNNLAGAKNGN